MSASEIFSLISLICYILAGICLVSGVLLWWFFKIPAANRRGGKKLTMIEEVMLIHTDEQIE